MVDDNQSISNISQTSLPRKNTDFIFGPYVPIITKENDIFIDPKGIIDSYFETNPISKRWACDVLPDDAITDAPSAVNPLLLKKKNRLPQVTTPISSDEQMPVNRKPFDDYIRATCVASLTNPNKNGQDQSISTLQDYYKSSVGELLLGIGMSRAMESQLQDRARKLARKIRRKGENCDAASNLLDVVKEQLKQTKASNNIFSTPKLHKCPRCPFKTEFAVVLNGHLETPHVQKKDYLCNWCEYKTIDPASILYHCLVKHKQRCRIEKPPALHLCQYCPFEHKEKRRMKVHLARCEILYELNIKSYLGPHNYGANEYPAVTSKLITREDIRAYENTLKTLRLAAYSPHQIKVSSVPIMVVSKKNGHSSSSKFVGGDKLQTISAANASVHMMSKDQFCNNHIQKSHSAQLTQILSGQNANPNPNRVGILQYPRIQSPFMIHGESFLRTADIVMAPQNVPHPPNNVTTPAVNTNDLMANEDVQLSNQKPTSPTRSPTPMPKGSTFVICEICDAYIKDLGQLKSHMQWIHKVKIHQKMLISRPPLNCQKCQWRFFTDQGLERHLLGAHGLVTSNMQELVDKACDSGRCTVCGRAYANKLVAHMKEVHKLTLKPAHLTYKCTVCSATFNLYRLFENHVYTVHSDSVRRISAN